MTQKQRSTLHHTVDTSKIMTQKGLNKQIGKKQTRLMETKRGQGCNLNIRQTEFKSRL